MKFIISFDFNPRLREGGDLFLRHLLHIFLFQSTPPRRRRQYIHCLSLHLLYFNPRLREGGDFFQCIHNTNFFCNFNPRLREGGDNISTETLDAIKISIHASAKEATKNPLEMRRRIQRFQSTPPRRRRLILSTS